MCIDTRERNKALVAKFMQHAYLNIWVHNVHDASDKFYRLSKKLLQKTFIEFENCFKVELIIT